VGGVPTLWGVSPHCGDTPIGVSPQSQKKIKESLNLGLNKKNLKKTKKRRKIIRKLL